MEIFLGIMIFIMGTFFGSFFTLAVYRIPLKKDITHVHSFCPNCNHRLGVLDLVPVFSYIFLGGKCRYCGQKIRIRYLCLEVLSGLVFLIAYLSLNIQNVFIEQIKFVYFIEFVFAYVTFALVAGIDKEYRNINLSVLLFGAICEMLYMLYLYIIGVSIYRYIIYLVLFFVLYIINIILHKKQDVYIFQILALCSYILLIVNIKSMFVIFLLAIIISLILRIIDKEKYTSIHQIPIGFAMCISTVCIILVENFIKFTL